ncbi:MAG: hypothetical protein KY428_04420 [Bacteroidetes bacterium]|nr:hypothetical protein [Bacteroidota bacterium]
MKRHLLLLLLAGAICLAGCGGKKQKVQQAAPLAAIDFRSIPTPADSLARYPHLLADTASGRLWMSWMVQSPDAAALWLAELDSETNEWQQPTLVTEGAQLMVNWADYPHLIPGKAQPGMLYLQTADASLPYAYHVMLKEAGKGTQRLHQDSSATEHGFVSAMQLANADIATVWLDGHKYAGAEADDHGHGHGGEMALHYRSISSAGDLLPALELDGRTCDCCNTALVAIPGGAMAFYRDRSEDDIRDISYVRYQQDQWSAPKKVHHDGWEIRACPVNGPAADALDDQVVVAWFTGANGDNQVKVRFSADAGNSWGPVLVADSLQPMGRVGIKLLNSNSALLSWLDQQGNLSVRTLTPAGQMGETQVVADSLGSRQSGFPQLIRLKNKVYLAWTQPQPYAHIALLEGVIEQ